MEKGKETNQWVSVPMVVSVQSCQTAAIQSTLTTLCIMTQDGIDLFLIEKTFPGPTDAFTFKEIVLHSIMTTWFVLEKQSVEDCEAKELFSSVKITFQWKGNLFSKEKNRHCGLHFEQKKQLFMEAPAGLLSLILNFVVFN